MRHRSLLVIVVLAIGAHGCGLKGPLYLPEPAKEVATAPSDAGVDPEGDDAKDKKKSDQATTSPTQAPQ